VEELHEDDIDVEQVGFAAGLAFGCAFGFGMGLASGGWAGCFLPRLPLVATTHKTSTAKRSIRLTQKREKKRGSKVQWKTHMQRNWTKACVCVKGRWTNITWNTRELYYRYY
jgi:hypothetical protein